MCCTRNANVDARGAGRHDVEEVEAVGDGSRPEVELCVAVGAAEAHLRSMHAHAWVLLSKRTVPKHEHRNVQLSRRP